MRPEAVTLLNRYRAGYYFREGETAYVILRSDPAHLLALPYQIAEQAAQEGAPGLLERFVTPSASNIKSETSP